jgi:uncharacterized protein YjdB
MTFISVTGITGFPHTQMVVDTEYALTATVVPTGATNRTIEWSIVEGSNLVKNGTIEKRGSSSWILTPIKPGNIKVRATVRNGIQQ